jgi:subtilase family serine protease
MPNPNGQSQVRAGVVTSLVVITLLAATAFSQTAGNAFRLIPNSRNLGPENLSKSITVTVWLNQHNKAAFDESVRQMYLKGSPNYHHWLTKEQYTAGFAPTAEDVAKLREFLTSRNLSVSAVDKNNHFISATGRISDVQSAFHVQINRFQVNGQMHRANLSEPVLDASVAPLVKSVQGLNNFSYQPDVLRPIDPDSGKPVESIPLASAAPGPDGLFFNGNCLRAPETKTFRTKGGGPSATYTGNRYGSNITSVVPHLPSCGYDSAEIRKGYGLIPLYQKGWDGSGQTIVIVDAYGSPTIRADATTFSKINRLPRLTPSNFAILKVGGESGCTPADGCTPGNWSVETTLDVEWAHTVAPGANIVLIVAKDNSFTNLDLANFYATDNLFGSVISNSWGGPESALIPFPSELAVQNDYAQLAASFGISDNFSSGDSGDFFNAIGATTVSMPAAAPFATGVGGTSLFLKANHQMLLQTGWGTNFTRIANPNPNPPTVPPLPFGFQSGAGGGTSGFWAKPSYQSSLSGNWRQVPDISYVADPDTGVEIIITPDGVPGHPQFVEVIGGTSLACPMFSAMWAIANQAAGEPLGQAAASLYDLPADAITDVTDVTAASANNVTGTISVPGKPHVNETADDLAAPLGNTTGYVSALFQNSSSTRWDVFTFGTDSSLTTGPGWDNVTGLGTPNGLHFVEEVVAATKEAKAAK